MVYILWGIYVKLSLLVVSVIYLYQHNAFIVIAISFPENADTLAFNFMSLLVKIYVLTVYIEFVTVLHISPC